MDPFTISLAMAGINAGISAYQGYKANQKEKDARAAAEKFGAQQRAVTETDMMAGLKVPQLGAQLASQQLGQQYATGVEALRGSGAAGVLGGVTGLADVYSDATLKQAAQLEQLEFQRNAMQAENAQNVEMRRAERQDTNIQSQLTGAQQAAALANATKNQAIASGLSAVTDIGLKYMENAPLYQQQKVSDMGVTGPISIKPTNFDAGLKAPQMPAGAVPVPGKSGMYSIPGLGIMPQEEAMGLSSLYSSPFS
jgi:hypothetical protein